MSQKLKGILQKLKNVKTVGIVGAVLTILGTIIPALYITGAPYSYIEGDGKFICLAMVIVGILIWRNRAGWSLVPTGLACALIVRWLYTTMPAKAIEQQLFSFASYGAGIYLMIIGLCLCLIYGVAGGNVIKEHEKIPFNSKYFLIGLILPVIGLYYWIVKKREDKIISHNSLLGASIGIVIFLFIVLLFGMN